MCQRCTWLHVAWSLHWDTKDKESVNLLCLTLVIFSFFGTGTSTVWSNSKHWHLFAWHGIKWVGALGWAILLVVMNYGAFDFAIILLGIIVAVKQPPLTENDNNNTTDNDTVDEEAAIALDVTMVAFLMVIIMHSTVYEPWLGTNSCQWKSHYWHCLLLLIVYACKGCSFIPIQQLYPYKLLQVILFWFFGST